MKLLQRILLIEDDNGFYESVKLILRPALSTLQTIIHVTTLAEALEKLRDNDIDLIILDPGLPDSKGLNSMRVIRERYPQYRMIILTALDDAHMAQVAEKNGVRYVSKSTIAEGQVSILPMEIRLAMMEESIALQTPPENDVDLSDISDFWRWRGSVEEQLKNLLTTIKLFSDNFSVAVNRVCENNNQLNNKFDSLKYDIGITIARWIGIGIGSGSVLGILAKVLKLWLVIIIISATSEAATVTLTSGQSISNAWNTAGGGGTVILHTGNYSGGFIIPSGSQSSPSTLKAFGDGPVIISATKVNGPDVIGLGVSGSWITIGGPTPAEGLILDGGTNSINESQDNFLVNNILIQNNEMRNSNHSCLLLNGGPFTIINNHIHNCGTNTALDHGIYASIHDSYVAHNEFDHNACFGVQNYYGGDAGSPDNNIYDGNVFHDNNCGFVHSSGTNITFINNVQYHDGLECGGCNSIQIYVDGTTVLNNTIIDGTINTSRHPNSTQVSGNLLCNTGFYNDDTFGASDNITTCSAFVDSGNNDYHLTTASGLTVPCFGSVTHDKDNQPRPFNGSTCQAGAYEFIGTTPPPVFIAYRGFFSP